MTDAQQFEAFMQNYQNMVFSTAMRLVVNQAALKLKREPIRAIINAFAGASGKA